MQPFPRPKNYATHKIWLRLADWLQRYSSSNVWNFRHSRSSNSKMSGLIRPKIELDRALIAAILVVIQSQMNELAWRHHLPIISLWEIFRRSRAANSESVVRTGRNSNSSEILCMSLLPASIKMIGWKSTEKRWRHYFPHYKSMGAVCCHGHQTLDPVCLKTICSLSPPQWCYT